MEKNNTLDSLRVVLLLRYKENNHFFRFCIVGFVGLATDSLLFNILRLLIFNSRNAALISGMVAMTVTFLLNNYWSFGDRKLVGLRSKMINIVLYYVSSTIPIIIRAKIIEFVVYLFGETFIISNAAFFIGTVLGLIWNFTVYNGIIWRRKHA